MGRVGAGVTGVQIERRTSKGWAMPILIDSNTRPYVAIITSTTIEKRSNIREQRGQQ